MTALILLTVVALGGFVLGSRYQGHYRRRFLAERDAVAACLEMLDMLEDDGEELTPGKRAALAHVQTFQAAPHPAAGELRRTLEHRQAASQEGAGVFAWAILLVTLAAIVIGAWSW